MNTVQKMRTDLKILVKTNRQQKCHFDRINIKIVYQNRTIN